MINQDAVTDGELGNSRFDAESEGEMKAKNCDECKHFSETLATYKRPCKLLHKPRFYVPRTTTQAEAGDYGWKRRCNDFERSEK